MAEGQTYNIPETQLEWFREKLAKLNKRSLKLVGERVYSTIVGYHFLDGEGPKKLQQMKMYEVFVSHPDVKLNGWQFVARMDHSQEAGTVIRVVPGQTLPVRYRETGQMCEHCNEKRMRRDTFVMHRVGTKEYKQVGTSCLRDFTGHNSAEKWAQVAEMLAIIGDYARGHGFERSGGLNDYRWINARYYTALVADSVLTRGWTSAAAAKTHGWISTRMRAEALMSNGSEPSAVAYDLASTAMEWVQDFGEDGRELNDWEHNARIVAQSEALELRHLGIAASVVGVYWNRFVRQSDNAKVSNYVGEKGKRLITKVTLKAVIPGETSIRHIFEDDIGNVMIWFASVGLSREHIGNEITISALVKDHQEYRNKKQTIVNRVKIVV